jgi:hypothetical protein
MQKLRKCNLYPKQICYLGHIILEEGIFVDLENIESIMNWPTPKNVMNIIFVYGPCWLLQRFH